MENYISKLFDLRRNQLDQDVNETEAVLTKYKDGTAVLRDDVLRCHLNLKHSIINIKESFEKYVSQSNVDDSLVQSSLGQQVKGEKMLLELQLIIDELKSLESTSREPSRSTSKLPTLELVKFNGNILEWTEFWDKFAANVHSQNLENVEKLAYLLSCLEGDAKETMRGLTVTNDNYVVAIETLQNRYGHSHKVIDSHYEAINKIKRCNYTADECRKNLNEINTHIRVLSSLGENIESNHLRSSITEKFPDKVIYDLNLLTSNDHSISTIRNTLGTIIMAMEEAKVNERPLAGPSSSTEAFHSLEKRPTFSKGKRVKKRPLQHRTPVDHHGQSKKRKFTGVHNDDMKRVKRSCIFCDGLHFNDQCTIVKDIQERKKKLGERCYICLKIGHRAFKCLRKRKCHYCKGNHNRCLCPQNKPQGKTNTDESFIHVSNYECPKIKSFLQTAMARVAHNQKTIECRILLDSGSQRSYITTGLAKNLDLTSNNVDTLLIFTFGAKKPTEMISPCSDIVIRTKRGVERSIHVNIVPHITDRIPKPNISTTGLIDIMADSGSTNDQRIDMLIGNDYYFSFIRNNTIQIDKDLHLIDTDFGWIVSGHHDEKDQEENILAFVTYHQGNKECVCFTEPDLPLKQSDIKFLWSLENIGITDPVKATREENAVQHFNDTVIYHEDRYYVKWPWTTFPPELPTNYNLAYGRLKGLLQRLDKSSLQEYNTILLEQLQNGIIETVEADAEVQCQTVPPVHYLPHHIVKQSGKRGRVVYDASAKTKDHQSLNQCLYRGPCMLQDLIALLLNFRMYKIGIVADVEKAFLQVGLQDKDRDVTRFLWVKDIDKPLSNENLLHFRFCRVPFGIISSPFLLTATIRYHISKKNSELLKGVANKCYVDNLVTGTNTAEEAFQLFEETKKTFQELSMNLRDWTSNEKTFIERVPESYRAKEDDVIKVLGLMWNKNRDTIYLNIKKEVLIDNDLKTVTKREVLRTLASIYDPCGIVSPVVMPIKLFLQLTWEKQYRWDAPLSHDLVQTWKKIKDSLEEIKTVEIPRYVKANADGETENQLHCFTDASKDSYAAVVYLRSRDGSTINISFMMSKNRVAPLEREKKSGKTQKKKLTTPQLELLGCVIGNRLLTYLKENIELPINRIYLWTDSLVVLNWIHSDKLLPPFIANRIEEIKQNVGLQTCYVNTRQNPADVATRPELWKQKKKLWLQGPAFLTESENKWPSDMHLRSHMLSATALPSVAEGLTRQSSDISIPMEVVEGDSPRPKRNQVTSQVQVIKNLQQTFFPEEAKGKQTDLSRNLGLFTDVDGLLRCKGRMANANWSYDMKYPILLPRECEFTKNIVKEIHEKNYHVGPPHTLNLVRQQFWIPKGRPVVERILKKCYQCVKQGGGPYPLPPTPALPAERVNYSPPFTYTGIDYFGPVYVDTENGQQKRWVCLLTCLAVRAIHMEIVKDLTAEECIMALRRFTATRGVVSDNALYFRLSSEILNSDYTVKNNVRWRFIPQLAPWHGAFYERMVGLVKQCMKRTLEKLLLNDTQLLTIIKEIESVVNTRPLTRVGPEMDVVLRPCDFLSLGNCVNLEITEDIGIEKSDSMVKKNLIASWKRGQNMINQFKMMFINQYLTSLRERYQHSHKQPRVKSFKEPRVGELVQIKGESKNRNNWKVGKIINLIKGPDGHCRVAQIKVGDIVFTRSIGHLYPLELDESIPQTESTEIMEPVIRKYNDSTVNDPQTGLNRCLPEDTGRSKTSIERQVCQDTAPQSCVEEGEVTVEVSDVRPSTTEEQETLQVENGNTINTENDDETREDVVRCDESPPRNKGLKREAALRAREKIAEWTRQLFINL